jgi:hypothetical protein
VVLVVTNATGHLGELNDIVLEVAKVPLPSSQLRFRMETGEPELRASFEDVVPHFFRSKLEITEVQPVLDYVASMRAFVGRDDMEPVLSGIGDRVAAIIQRERAFVVSTGAGCFVCR